MLHRHIDYSAASIFTPPIKTPSEYCLSVCLVSTVHCVQPMSSRPSRGHDREGRSTVSPSSDLPAGLIPRSLVGCEDLRAQFVRLTSSSLSDMKGGQWRVDYDGVRVLTGPGGRGLKCRMRRGGGGRNEQRRTVVSLSTADKIVTSRSVNMF